MGISNLLPFLKPVTCYTHLKNLISNCTLLIFFGKIGRYRGKHVGIDAMCWIHRGASSCAFELLNDEPTDKFLKFILSMLELLRFYEVLPLLVFDGLQIPAKKFEDHKRNTKRDAAKKEARRLIKEKPNPRDNREILSKCQQAVSIDQAMIDQVIAVCKALDVKFIVAPYEADAQLAYLCRKGDVAAVISEDSDLLAYGCPHVLYKLDKAGNCQEIDMTFLLSIPSSIKLKTAQQTTDNRAFQLGEGAIDLISQLRKLSQPMFTDMCILSGSDYAQDVHLKGMGIKTALHFILQHKSLRNTLKCLLVDPKWSDRIVKFLPFEEVNKKYVEAQVAFYHHIIYDIGRDCLTYTKEVHTELPHFDLSNTDIKEIVGSPPENYQEYAYGELNPRNGCKRSIM
ncbi:XPG N-terminal domain-containing protein, partial [Cardiosporidium cionae]